MKKLFAGLTVLASMSAFAGDCNLSAVKIYSDNPITNEKIDEIKKSLKAKRYSVESFDSEEFSSNSNFNKVELIDSSSESGLILSLGILRDNGFESAERYAGFNDTVLGYLGYVYNNKIKAPIIDTYNRLTPNATTFVEIENCKSVFQKNDDVRGGHCQTKLNKSKKSLENLTSNSVSHDESVIAWSLKQIPSCEK